jgi:arylsulfatase A-like enzyme
MHGNVTRGFRLAEPSRHLANVLGRHGYHTALAGVQHVMPQASGIGYREVLPGGPAEAHRAAAAFLRRPPRRPFFLSVGFHETHRPFPEAPAPTPARSPQPPAPLPSLPATRADAAAFHASARRLDEKVGQVLSALLEADLEEETLVVYTTDHGPAFPGMKCTLGEGGIGVALLLSAPGLTTPGTEQEALVSHLDIAPTLCDWAGVPPPRWYRGRSLAPLLRGEVPAVREEAFAELTYHAAYEPQRAVRTGRYKYIRRHLPRRRVMLCNVDDSPSKEALLARGWAAERRDREQLYDLALDPLEQQNRARDPRYGLVLADLRDRLARWQERTADPLRRGGVAPPPDGRFNHPDCRSPHETRFTDDPLATAAADEEGDAE